jgi:hypothetical protein
MKKHQYELIERALRECIASGEATPRAAEIFVRHLAAEYHAFNPGQFLAKAIPTAQPSLPMSEGNQP